MDQAEQSRVTRAVGRALLGVAPPDWTQIRAEYRSAGRHIEVDVFVAGPDRVIHPVRPPAEVVDGLGRLRQVMYQPGRGTWLSAVYNLEPPSAFSVDFEPDLEPRWRRLPPPIGFQDELRFFPRTDDHIPPWFRQRAGLPPAPPPTPPTGTPAPGAPAAPGTPQQPPAPGGPPAPATPPTGAPAPQHAHPPAPQFTPPRTGPTPGPPAPATPPTGTPGPQHAHPPAAPAPPGVPQFTPPQPGPPPAPAGPQQPAAPLWTPPPPVPPGT